MGLSTQWSQKQHEVSWCKSIASQPPLHLFCLILLRGKSASTLHVLISLTHGIHNTHCIRSEVLWLSCQFSKLQNVTKPRNKPTRNLGFHYLPIPNVLLLLLLFSNASPIQGQLSICWPLGWAAVSWSHLFSTHLGTMCGTPPALCQLYFPETPWDVFLGTL